MYLSGRLVFAGFPLEDFCVANGRRIRLLLLEASALRAQRHPTNMALAWSRLEEEGLRQTGEFLGSQLGSKAATCLTKGSL